MKIARAAAVAIVIALPLAGCLSSNVQMYNPIDTTDKTMTVPPGNSLLVGAIKQRLYARGWKLMVYAGPTRTVGTVSPKVDLATADTFHTRYRLILRQAQFDTCILNGAPAINYDLSLIDNQSGEEVFTESGRDCVPNAADKFVAALSNDTAH